MLCEHSDLSIQSCSSTIKAISGFGSGLAYFKSSRPVVTEIKVLTPGVLLVIRRHSEFVPQPRTPSRSHRRPPGTSDPPRYEARPLPLSTHVLSRHCRTLAAWLRFGLRSPFLSFLPFLYQTIESYPVASASHSLSCLTCRACSQLKWSSRTMSRFCTTATATP